MLTNFNIINKEEDLEGGRRQLGESSQAAGAGAGKKEEGEEEEGLSAQKLESQHTGALERSQIIKDELILERQNNEELKYQLEEFEELLGRDERNQEDLDSLQLHIQKEEGEEEAARGY